MAFGPIMQFEIDGLRIELAPFTKDSMKDFVDPGMQQYSVLRYLGLSTANTAEDEEEWYDKMRKDSERLVWGIWVVEGDTRTIIGNTALNEITRKHIHQATSGSMIFRTEYWGRGIASAAHAARTWYAFHIMGLHRIKSAVLQANHGSRKALMKSGYTLVYTERNEAFVDGQLMNLDCLECLNPREPFWQQWWHGDRPTNAQRLARAKTEQVLNWAEENVTLP
jgi:ribosomal-protein-alanine N-acetyltransferase